MAHILFLLDNAIIRTREFMLCSYCWELAEVQGNAPSGCLSYSYSS